jgi:alpha-amylase
MFKTSTLEGLTSRALRISEGYPAVYHKDYAEEPGCYGLKRWIDNLVWIHENLANGTTTSRFNDDRVIVLERQGWPGLLTAISNDPLNRRRITCHTAFPPGTQLHDYTGRHGDLWTDHQGQATFTVPSNAFGSGQSYLCFSRTHQDKTPVLHRQSTHQCFYGAVDLDVAPLANGRHITLPRIYPSAGTDLQAALRLDHRFWKSDTKIALEVLDPTSRVVGAQTWASNARDAFAGASSTTGWHTLRLTASGLTDKAPFELDVTYTAPQRL